MHAKQRDARQLDLKRVGMHLIKFDTKLPVCMTRGKDL